MEIALLASGLENAESHSSRTLYARSFPPITQREPYGAFVRRAVLRRSAVLRCGVWLPFWPAARARDARQLDDLRV
jgi:hypothetical protein